MENVSSINSTARALAAGILGGGLLAGALLLGGVSPALAAEGATESVNSGGLVFTFDNAPGQTKTTVSNVNNGVVTIKGGNTNITVTQEQVGSGPTIANALVIGGSGDDVYTGTITLQNVTLVSPDSDTTPTADDDGVPAIKFVNASPNAGVKGGATVVLAQGTTILQGADQPASTTSGLIYMDGATPDTLVVQDATIGSIEANNQLGSVPTEVPAINVAALGNTTIELGNATLYGGDGTDGAIQLSGDAAATEMQQCTITASGDAIVTGVYDNSGTLTPAAASLNIDPADDNGLVATINGNGDVTFIAGIPDTAPNKANPTAGIALDDTGGPAELVCSGTGTIGATGSSAEDLTTGPAKDGGIGIAINSATSTHASMVTVNSGIVNAQGGEGGSVTEQNDSDNNDKGGAGGSGISIAGSSSHNATLVVNGGTVNAVGGQGGSVGASTATVGNGGNGIAGPGDGAGSYLVVKNNTGTGMTGPTVTAMGGLDGAKNGTAGTTLTAAVTNLGASNNGTGIQIANGQQGRRTDTRYPWVALVNTVEPNAKNLSTIVGFGGMDGSFTSVSVDSSNASTSTTPNAASGAYVNTQKALVSNPTPSATYGWVQITPAQITDLSAGVNKFALSGTYPQGTAGSNKIGNPTPYVVVQTNASMTGNIPDDDYYYTGGVTATFEGLQNVNPCGDFWNLATGDPFSDDYSIEAAGNVTQVDTQVNTTNVTYFWVNPTATGDLTLALDEGVSFADEAETIAEWYPELTADIASIEVPVVYTVTLNTNPTEQGDSTSATTITGVQDYNGGSAKDMTSFNLYTNPNGNGQLVFGNGLNLQAAGATQNLGLPNWQTPISTTAVQSLPTPDTTQAIANGAGTATTPFNLVKQAGDTSNFVGYFNETPESTPADWTQVAVDDLTWDRNATLTAEWGTIQIDSVTPTPTTLQQGTAEELTANYTIQITSNDKIQSYNLGDTGLSADWKGIYTNVTFGSAESNGVTITQVGGDTVQLENGAFAATSVASVAASQSATTGHYRVWPQTWGSVLGEANPITPAQAAQGQIPPEFVYGIVEVTAGSGSTEVVRLYNPWTFEHLYSDDADEIARLTDAGWDNEDTAWVCPTNSDRPIYRLYNPYNQDHLYTTDVAEYEWLQENLWQGEGVKFYSAPETSAPVYRIYNPYMTTDAGAFSHLWTGSIVEYNDLQTAGCKGEGVAWNAVSVPQPLE